MCGRSRISLTLNAGYGDKDGRPRHASYIDFRDPQRKGT
jgi:hypothetical protein